MAPIAASGMLPVPDVEGVRLPGTCRAGRLVDEVAAIARDPSFTATGILELLNRGLFEIAGRVRLPELETSAEVSASPDRAEVRLPADYHRDLLSVTVPAERRRVRLYPCLESLERRFPGLDRTGNVLGAAAGGRSLYYQGVPASPVTLRLRYYRAPEPLETESGRVDCLPQHLAASLLVSYACREIFERIEEGADGRKTQTERFEARFDAAMRELEAFYGPEYRESDGIADVMGYGFHEEPWTCV